MNTTWFLVAEARRARLLETNDNSHQAIALQEFLAQPSTDETSVTPSRGQRDYSSRTSPAEVEADRFIREMAEMLKSAANDNLYHSLIIICPAKIHASLVRYLNSNVKSRIRGHLNKDYAHLNDTQLVRRLQNDFPSYHKEEAVT